MLNVGALVCENVHKRKTKKPRADHPRDITSQPVWQRDHGRWRDQVIGNLYADSGIIDHSLYTNLDRNNPGWAWINLREREGQEMALNLDSLKVTETQLEKSARGREKRDLGPIPEWVKDSYDKGVAKRIPVKGQVEEYMTKPRQGHQAKLATKITGDAGELANLLRQAATELGLGISIQYDQKENRVTAVKFRAQEKQQRGKQDDEQVA